jgi:membrane protein YdbS with pleckstrin-like domain
MADEQTPESVIPESPGMTTEPTPTAVPTHASGPDDFESLDPRVIKLWRLRQSIFAAVLGGVLLFPLFAIGFGAGQWVPAIAGWLLVVGLLMFRLWWHPRRAYRGRGYRLDERVLEIKEGIWFRSLTLLPLSRLQHVDLDAGPIERGLGLASLVFHTAGTNNAIIVLPGLEAGRARELRDHLVAIGGDDAV